MSMTAHSIAVVGASNIDVSATSFAPLVDADSNPGAVGFSLGGVGRNIAESLARLGQRVLLVTAMGEDHFTAALRLRAREVGYDIDHSAYDPAMRNSVYICVNDSTGEMRVAVNDMRVCERLTPDFLRSRLPYLDQADSVVLDANIPEKSITFLAEHCDKPLYADTVSTAKALRLRGALGRIHTLKTNRIEAQALTGVAIRDERGAQSCALRLHDLGVKQVFITLGANGAYASDGRERFAMPSLARDIVNTTGCGDSFFAGVIAASVAGQSLRDILLAGLAMSAICAGEPCAVSQTVTPQRLRAFISHIEGGASK